ncbi:MAG: hypothetical protein MRERC_2c070 [Mycoplasmataceae bacterium RC_NB112A]|nr:MAG: hypothetical protein MRERC_2c070 [Mycoplasmataceae bacterium RC_NB112A]
MIPWVVANLSRLKKANELSSQIRQELTQVLYCPVEIDSLKTKILHSGWHYGQIFHLLYKSK